MAYTRQEFALELKEKIQKKESIKCISDWAVFIYNKHKHEIDYEFQRFLFDLEGMGTAPEYEFSYEELDGFADRLLAGEFEIDAYNRRASAITREEFGLQLKEKVRKKENMTLIGVWVFQLYLEYLPYIDDTFCKLLTDVSCLETPGFELSYEELDKIADRLIAGEDVKL
jgi:hypothetical protein